jgi:lactobin A/cerein 7B family class IIb bacteriocin
VASPLHCEVTMKDTFSSLSTEELESVSGGYGNFVAGDSIAVGVAGQLHWQHDAKVGAPSKDIIHRVPQGHFHTLILSAGSNDPRNPHLIDNLNTMRRRATGGGVVWIAPVEPHARAAVTRVAHEHGDRVVTFTPGHDHVHPRSYAELAHRIEALH